MKLATIFTFARIVLIGLLAWAFFSNSYSYFVILRWSVFVVSAYGVWRSIKQTEYLFALIHFSATVVFNPFFLLRFQRSTWNVIDGIAIFLFLFSIFLIDSSPAEKATDSPLGHRALNGISILGASFFIFVGSWFIWATGESFIDAVRLYKNNQQTVANITEVKQHMESAEIAPGRERSFEVYEVTYTFDLIDGKTYSGSAELHDEPEGNTINIQYEANNPNNNRPFVEKKVNLFEEALMAMFGIGVGGVVIYSSVDSIRKRIKELREIKSEPSHEAEIL